MYRGGVGEGGGQVHAEVGVCGGEQIYSGQSPVIYNNSPLSPWPSVAHRLAPFPTQQGPLKAPPSQHGQSLMALLPCFLPLIAPAPSPSQHGHP